MPYSPVDRVEVHLWDMLVGVAALDPTYGYYAFAYDPAFRGTGIELAPLHMPLNAQDVYLFPDLPVNTYKRLPALLADALPDDFGNALINSYMARQGMSASQVSALDRLAYMGTRAMGALTFKPVRGPRTQQASAIDMRKLVLVAREAVHGAIDDDEHTSAALRSIIDVGTSAGGARAKAVVAIDPQTKELRSGQVDAPAGFEHWLLKFDGVGVDKELGASQNYGRIEFAYHLMARSAGIRMSDCDLLEENGRAHFMTRRFDRHGSSGRHHVQTLCAMQHLDYKLKGVHSYEQFFLTMDQLDLPYEDRVEGFRRMVFNVVGMNCDDHVKNLSFILPEDEMAWRLAPAYDLTFAHNPKGEWTHQHLMSVNEKFKNIELSDLLIVADRFGVRQAQRVIDEVREACQLWSVYADAAGVPEQEIAFIDQQLVTLT
ncbi:type II toxin-antitoxin system HipA family toxin [Mitsuaria sp. CC2]|jgi:serine/threonine-protein kinase HipA|uniref:type II toxin-antitoxin system HipA family toxin n=1 Tax=Mitsuaria sp. CC2 TaxID=3029186 RepID=UPI003B8C3504